MQIALNDATRRVAAIVAATLNIFVLFKLFCPCLKKTHIID
jgi:hypothetical protein